MCFFICSFEMFGQVLHNYSCFKLIHCELKCCIRCFILCSSFCVQVVQSLVCQMYCESCTHFKYVAHIASIPLCMQSRSIQQSAVIGCIGADEERGFIQLVFWWSNIESRTLSNWPACWRWDCWGANIGEDGSWWYNWESMESYFIL